MILTKHLLKTIGTDLTNSFFELVANQNLMSLNENENFTAEVRIVLVLFTFIYVDCLITIMYISQIFYSNEFHDILNKERRQFT